MEERRFNEIILADIASHNVDGKSVGHFFTLCDNYLQMYPGCKIAGGPIYEQHIKKEELIRLPYDSIAGDNFIKVKWREYKNLKALFQASNGKRVVLQQAATATIIMFLSFVKKPQCKLYLICYDDNGIRSTFKRLVYTLSKKKIDGIICPNESIGNTYDLPYCVVPDYIYTGSTETKTSERNIKKYDFCLVGRLSPEKGAEEIVKVLGNTRFKILIAGKPQNKEIENQLTNLARHANNIELHLGYVSEEDYRRYISESRYALLNYQGEYSLRSSGVVYDMIFAGVPVVGRRCKALQFIEDKNCGFLLDSLDELSGKKDADLSQYEAYMKGIAAFKKAQKINIEKLYTFITDNQ